MYNMIAFNYHIFHMLVDLLVSYIPGNKKILKSMYLASNTIKAVKKYLRLKKNPQINFESICMNDPISNKLKCLARYNKSEELIKLITRQLNIRSGVYDGIADNTWLIDASKMDEFIDLLSTLILFHGLKVSIHGKKQNYFNNMHADISKYLLRMKLRAIRGKKIFIIDLLYPGSKLMYSRKVLVYKKSEKGLCSIKHNNNILASRFQEGSLNDYFPRAESNDLSKLYHNKVGDIDLVITWVNQEDNQWKKLWQERYGKDSSIEKDPDRYSDCGELKYCLRSIEKYLPWYRKIFIASNCRKPDWLTNMNGIEWVDHSEFITPTALPTFSSHAIEASLYKITDLKEHFIYFNDDFVLTEPVQKSDFFDNLGRAIMCLEGYGVVNQAYAEFLNKDYLIASNNSRKLIASKYNISMTRLHKHLPYAHRKSNIIDFEQEFSSEFRRTINSPSRSRNDINVMSFAAHYYGLINNKSVLEEKSSQSNYLLVRPSNILHLLWNRNKYKYLCFNDGDGSSTNLFYKLQMHYYLESKFPSPSSFEK